MLSRVERANLNTFFIFIHFHLMHVNFVEKMNNCYLYIPVVRDVILYGHNSNVSILISISIKLGISKYFYMLLSFKCISNITFIVIHSKTEK